MSQVAQWIWVIVALLLFVGEIFTAGFVLSCFGIGAAAAAVVAFLGAGPIWQLVVFGAVSLVAVYFSRPFVNRISNPNIQEVGIDRVLNREGIVIETIDPAAGSGVVRVRSETWSAHSENDEMIPAGERVLVLAVDGTHLVVRRLDPGAAG